MKAYLWVPEDRKSEILECGLDMSLASEFKCRVNEMSGRAFLCRLSPGDWKDAVKPADSVMIKADLSQVRAFVAENIYLEGCATDGYEGGGLWECFQNSIVPWEQYRLGNYRKPLCLIVNPILPEALSEYDSRMDETVMYPDSETLYVDRRFAQAAEAEEGFKERALEAYYDRQGGNKDSMGGINIYRDADGNVSYIMKRGT